MQPYFLPYIGYFQLIHSVDSFVLYDNIEYTKKGWINRNRILVNNRDEYITLPLKKDSDYLHIRQRLLADSFAVERERMIRRIREAYRKAPFFDNGFSLAYEALNCSERNLFTFIHHSIKLINNYLGITTPVYVSSDLEIDHTLKSEKKVMAICKALGATDYINPIGGLKLYSMKSFKSENLGLHFLESKLCAYPQFNEAFVPWLSILDVIMFNDQGTCHQMLCEYSLIDGKED